MTGSFLIRMRSPALALVVAACALLAGLVASAGARAPDTVRPSAQPPTAAEVRQATRRFLAGRRAPRVPSPRRARSSGGAGTPSDSILPESRVVSFYGAPQLTRTIVGRYGPAQAGRRLLQQASAYEGANRRPVIPAFNLIGVIATASSGPDGKYRVRQSPAVIDTYLAAARRIGARLMLDIQPGRAGVLAELRALRRWVRQPDVDLGIDPEWNVGRRGIPGRTEGSIGAKKLNRFSRRMQRIINAQKLPPKLLVLHQFHRRSVRRPGRVRQRPDVEVTLNFDGIGSPAAKEAGYRNLSARRLHNGFSLFYLRDRPLMSPRAVMGLRPEADFLLYQ